MLTKPELTTVLTSKENLSLQEFTNRFGNLIKRLEDAKAENIRIITYSILLVACEMPMDEKDISLEIKRLKTAYDYTNENNEKAKQAYDSFLDEVKNANKDI